MPLAGTNLSTFQSKLNAFPQCNKLYTNNLSTKHSYFVEIHFPVCSFITINLIALIVTLNTLDL